MTTSPISSNEAPFYVGGSNPPPLWQIEFRLVEIIHEQNGIPLERIHSRSRFVEDLHIDSLDLVELILCIEERFEVTIPDDIGKQMFVRQPLDVGMMVEIIAHQWGTGEPIRKRWVTKKGAPPPLDDVPFTQFDGILSRKSGLCGKLHAPMSVTPSGHMQFRRQTDGMRCVGIPTQTVELGSDASDAELDQQPFHQAELEVFLMDAEPVSVTAYARFLNSIGPISSEILSDWCGVASDDRRGRHFQLDWAKGRWNPIAGTERQPMILVSWFGANAYSLWANRRDWRDYQTEENFLPSEAQWEYAARGSQSKRYPWGDAPMGANALVNLHRARQTYPSGLPLAAVNEPLGLSPFDLCHMAGNVWQWCADWYHPQFYAQAEASATNPINRRSTGIRSERGGSWIGPANLAQSSYRRGRPPRARGRCLGFRCISAIN